MASKTVREAARWWALGLGVCASACGYQVGPLMPGDGGALIPSNRLPDVVCPVPEMDAAAPDVVDVVEEPEAAAPDVVEAGPEGGTMSSVSCGRAPMVDMRCASTPNTPYQTAVRFGMFVTRLTTTSVDVCMRRTDVMGAQWVGPLLGTVRTMSGSTITRGSLRFGEVSRYFSVSPGLYEVRLVGANSPNCDSPLGELGRDLVVEEPPATDSSPLTPRAINEHDHYTIVLTGRPGMAAATTRGRASATLINDRRAGCAPGDMACRSLVRAFQAAPTLDQVVVTLPGFSNLALTMETSYRRPAPSILVPDCYFFNTTPVPVGTNTDFRITTGGRLLFSGNINASISSEVISIFMFGEEGEPGENSRLSGIMCDDLLEGSNPALARCRRIAP